MRRKLQVFVSSTYDDLRAERQAAVEAILQSGHIPAGMEMFVAGDEEQLRVIKRWIDESDVFMLILGKRYGSIDPTNGKSYTQLEYEYARGEGEQSRMPMFAIVLSDAVAREKLKQGAQRAKVYERKHRTELREFETLVKSGRICSIVDDAEDFKSAVINSLNEVQRRHKPMGWVRPGDLKFIYRDNDAVSRPILKYIDEHPVEKALFVQYSGVNIFPVLRRLWRSTSAKIELHVVDDKSSRVVGLDQPHRIAEFRDKLRHELSVADKDPLFSYYQYDAPGAPRIIMLDDKILAFGSFLYLCRTPGDARTLDVWGAEIPIALLRQAEPDFEVVRKSVDTMIQDWKTSGISKLRFTLDREKRTVADGQ